MLIFLSMLESDEERRLFTDLYNQYGNMMLHVAKRYFPKDMYAAEDVVQNAWIRVVDHFQKIQAVPSKKRGAYLVVIVRNEAITALRKQKPELQFDENFVEGYIDLENDNTRSIIDTIRAMPDIYRTVLEMRFVEERSTKEIAKALSLKETNSRCSDSPRPGAAYKKIERRGIHKMTEGEENIIIKGVLLEAISRDFSEELSNNKEVSVSPRFKRQMMAMMK